VVWSSLHKKNVGERVVSGILEARAFDMTIWVWPLCVQAQDGALLSIGERRLGAWEAVVFGASYVESALASVRNELCKHLICVLVTEASVVV
jgi:hypothetical protein